MNLNAAPRSAARAPAGNTLHRLPVYENEIFAPKTKACVAALSSKFGTCASSSEVSETGEKFAGVKCEVADLRKF